VVKIDLIRQLNRIFRAKSVAVIGASRRRNSVGHGVLKSLICGGVFNNKYCRPFRGRVYAINPKAKKLMGKKAYPSILSVKGNIGLAIICVPAKIVPKVMEECAKKKVKGVVIISAGFGEVGREGKLLEQKVLDIAKKAGIRVIGPNCLGIIRVPNRLNASFAPSMPPEGSIGFISQSGALADSIIDWALKDRYGFSTIVSIGNASDLTASDFLEWLGQDKKTRAIAMYIEGIKDGKRFMKVAKRVSRIKPIIALKAGKTQSGQKAVSSHTGSLAGGYSVYKAAFRQSGITIAETVEELFDFAKVLADQHPARKNACAIVTNGGGAGVLTADACESLGVNIVPLKKSTIKKLDRSGKMHPAYSRRNPLDIIGDALPERYKVAIDTLLGEDYIECLIVLQTLQTMTDSKADAKIVINAHRKNPCKPIICTYMGGKFSKKGIDLLSAHNIPDFNDPEKAAKAMRILVDRGRYLHGNYPKHRCRRCVRVEKKIRRIKKK
jgi:acetyltransferase